MRRPGRADRKPLMKTRQSSWLAGQGDLSAGQSLLRSPSWFPLLSALVSVRLQDWRRDRYLGFVWWLLEPLALSCTYLLLIKLAFRADRPAGVLFLMCAVLPYSWFTAATNRSLGSLRSNRDLLQGFRIAYWLLPTSDVIACGVRFLFGLVVLVLLASYYDIPLTAKLLWLPLLVSLQLVLTIACGLWLAWLQVFSEDTAHGWQILTRIVFFLSPSLYSLDRLPEAWRSWAMLNPFAVLFESYRAIFIGGKDPVLWALAGSGLLSTIILLSGLGLLHRCRGRLVLWL